LVFGSIDGQTSLSARQESIKEYNRAESETFIFLMSTRAGGLGVDLVRVLILSILVSLTCAITEASFVPLI